MSIVEDELAARKEHMTYGQWKLLHPRESKPKKGHSPLGCRRCEVCGSILKPRQRRFCSYECSQKRKREPHEE